MVSIFDKVMLSPSQLRTVAQRRYEDADYLRNSRLNKHANGVMYLGGFVLECLLKACLLERQPELTGPLPARRQDAVWLRRRHLLMRSHDLAALLEEMPSLLLRLAQVEPTRRYRDNLLKLCGQWTIFARYSPQSATMQEAGRFLEQIRELKPWLN